MTKNWRTEPRCGLPGQILTDFNHSIIHPLLLAWNIFTLQLMRWWLLRTRAATCRRCSWAVMTHRPFRGQSSGETRSLYDTGSSTGMCSGGISSCRRWRRVIVSTELFPQCIHRGHDLLPHWPARCNKLSAANIRSSVITSFSAPLDLQASAMLEGEICCVAIW